MTVYTLEDLQAVEGVQPDLVKKRLRINCFSGTFVRDRDFPIRFREEALKVLASYLESGIKSFIVQSPLCLTVWREEKPVEAGKGRSESTVTTSRASGVSIDGLDSSATKIVKRYRGQEYVVEVKPEIPQPPNSPAVIPGASEASVPDNAAPTSRQKIVKKYRGQEYIVEI